MPILGNPQSLNLYAYVDNNPVTSADGNGHYVLNGLEHVDFWGGRKSFTAADYTANNLAAMGHYSDDPTGAQQQSGQQQSTSQDQSTHFASVSYWPTGAGGFGHIGIQVDSDDTQGFSTKDPSLHWWQRLFGAPQARTEDDIAQHSNNGDVAPHSYLHIPVSADQAQAMQAAMAKRTANPGRYNLLFNNCAGFVESVLHAGGVSGVPHSEIFGPPVLYGILSLEH